MNPSTALSASLMPEGSVNAYYYGQDYSKLATYLDFLVPMVYKGNYKADTDWIGRMTNYIVSQANGKPVLVGLQTYRSDNDLSRLPAAELEQDINKALEKGASGYVLFRYGFVDLSFLGGTSYSPPETGSSTNPPTPPRSHHLSTSHWTRSVMQRVG